MCIICDLGAWLHKDIEVKATKNPRKRVTPPMVERIRSLRGQGVTYKEIARIMKISISRAFQLSK